VSSAAAQRPRLANQLVPTWWQSWKKPVQNTNQWK